MTAVALHCGVTSATGPFRSSNQDSAFGSARAAFVADGVGGQVAGDLASATLASAIGAHFQRAAGFADPSPDGIRRLIETGNQLVARRVRVQRQFAGMASTFTGVFVDGDRVTLAHIGDSRGYLLRGDRFGQVTRDDSVVQDLLDDGAMSPSAALTSPLRSVVTAVLSGHDGEADRASIRSERSRPGDRWLIASDGLSDYLDAGSIERIVRSPLDPAHASDALVESAIAAGSRDNVTVVVADVVAATDDPVEPDAHYDGAVTEFVGFC